MMALECGGDIVVIDAGVQFPEEGMPGIDFVIPDITYLRQNSDRVRAILITHGHEDHIGALPYVLAELDVPVYASRLTHGLISVKLREHGRLKDARLNVVEPNIRFKVGRFSVEFFRVCHSIPDAMGVAIGTPLGLVVHTGDFKIDHSPVDGKRTDFSSLARLAEEGVFLLMSDSTYAEVDGYTPSEQVVGEALDRVIGEAPGRVMVATFASLISRVQQVDRGRRQARPQGDRRRPEHVEQRQDGHQHGLPRCARRHDREHQPGQAAPAERGPHTGDRSAGRADFRAGPDRQRRAPGRRGGRPATR